MSQLQKPKSHNAPKAPVSSERTDLTSLVERPQPDNFAVSVVLPLFNEQDNIETLIGQICGVVGRLADHYEILCVNDGSTDATLSLLRRLSNQHDEVRVLNLSRNYGKEIALTAGLDHATGDVVITMDADLQHDPALISVFLDRWRQGADVVYAQRRDRETDGPVRNLLSRFFYCLFNKLVDRELPPGAGDFRLFDRRVVDALGRFRERNRFMKGIYVDVGFTADAVGYDVAPRSNGHSSWSLWKLWNFAIDGITSFSTVPIRIWTYVGFVVALLSFIYAAINVVQTLVRGVDVPGYATIVVLILFLGGVQLISIGVIGEYIGRIYQETKQRPLYIVESIDMQDSEKNQ